MLSFAITKGDKDDANDIILNDDPILTTSLVYTLITIFRMPFFFPFNPLEWAASKRYTKNAYKIPSINVDALKTPLHQIGGVETSVSFILFFLGGSIWALNKFPTIFLNLQRLIVCLHFGLWLYHTHIFFFFSLTLSTIEIFTLANSRTIPGLFLIFRVRKVFAKHWQISLSK